MIVAALQEELRLLAFQQIVGTHVVDRQAHADEPFDARVGASDAKPHESAETETSEHDRPPGKFAGEMIERCAYILSLSDPFVVDAFAQSHAAKIESQYGRAAVVQALAAW